LVARGIDLLVNRDYQRIARENMSVTTITRTGS